MSEYLPDTQDRYTYPEQDKETRQDTNQSGSPKKTPSYTSWGRYIRDLREEHSYTQAYVAKHLSINTSSYGYHERGERTPYPAMIISLANLYSIDYGTMLIMAAEDQNAFVPEQFARERANYTDISSLPPNHRTCEWVTEQERYLLEHYREQPQEVRKYIDNIVSPFSGKHGIYRKT